MQIQNKHYKMHFAISHEKTKIKHLFITHDITSNCNFYLEQNPPTHLLSPMNSIE